MNFYARLGWLGLVLVAVAPSAVGVGFGATPGGAIIGLPVDLRIPLRLEAGEEISADCVAAQVLFGDNAQPAGAVSAKLEPAPPGSLQRILHIQTTTRINEPVITVELAVGCVSRVSRSLTLFADPPPVVAVAPSDSAPTADSLNTPSAVLPAAATASLENASPVPTAATASRDPAAPKSEAAAKPAAAAPAAAPPMANRGSAPAPAPAASRNAAPAAPQTGVVAQASPTIAIPAGVPAVVAPKASAPTAVPRLRLATLEEGAAPTASAASAPLTSASSSEQAVTALAAATAAEAAASSRATELEAASAKLRKELDRTQQQINELSAKLRQVEEAQGTPLIVYGLSALVLLLSAALWVMWRQREQERVPSDWLTKLENPSDDAPPLAVGASRTVGPTPPAAVPAAAPATVATALPVSSWQAAPLLDKVRISETAPMPLPPLEIPLRLGGVGALEATSPGLDAERRPVSVEELIDLEQQAEFFVVLGQDEAAVELLTNHLTGSSDVSPLPYLKLLEIFKRRGDRPEYERLREAFNQQFAGHAPGWETELDGGLSLDDYPAVLSNLQRLWGSPRRAMDMLQASLLRRPEGEGDDPGPAARDVFELPAYRELMLLYAIARDLSELGEGGGAVDLLLPLIGGDARPPVAAVGGFERLLSTTAVEAQPSVAQVLTVDLSFDEIDNWPTSRAEPVRRAGGDGARSKF
jgi:hypothetical protein